jgi:Cys-tRNA(Pro)/Cys-tRNA(Cys) deacylase
VPTVLEEAALREETVFLNGGQRGLQVVMAPGEIVRVLGAVVAGVVA